MNYSSQMSWLDYKISKLKHKESLSVDEKNDLVALQSIKRDYKKTKDDSVELSWKNNPERMGS